ncbi:uncharacterized protein [Physeter macrocephalus]|uniref:Uncharacterized protein isoform X3 n=1 Tax=Physeter macrocephalus TaxID=9755 RepID=A0A9W2WJ01_PHYMC|nr:uncharacterized protein LOC129391911 isoform X3 [Physeter catodon]
MGPSLPRVVPAPKPAPSSSSTLAIPIQRPQPASQGPSPAHRQEWCSLYVHTEEAPWLEPSPPARLQLYPVFQVLKSCPHRRSYSISHSELRPFVCGKAFKRPGGELCDVDQVVAPPSAWEPVGAQFPPSCAV